MEGPMNSKIPGAQLSMNFGIARPSTTEQKTKVGLDPERAYTNAANELRDGVKLTDDGVRYRESVDAQGRLTLEFDNQVSQFAPNGLAVHQTKEGTQVELPGGYELSHVDGKKPQIVDAQGNVVEGKAKLQSKSGPRTVVGYSFKNAQGQEVSVDLTQLSFSVEDKKMGVKQEVDPNGNQLITATHLFRDPESATYSKDQVQLEVVNGQVTNVGEGEVKVTPQGLEFKNRLGAKIKPELPIALPEGLTANGEGVEIVKPEPAVVTPSPQPTTSGATPEVSPDQVEMTPQKAFEEALGVLRPDEFVYHGSPNPPMPGIPAPGPPYSETASGLVRSVGPDGGVVIQLKTNGITLQKPPGAQMIAFDNRSALLGRIPSEIEKMPINVQVSTRERPGMPPEEVYQFQDHSENIYTFFSHSGDFIVESRDRRVGTVVYPDGTHRTSIRGDNGTYEAFFDGRHMRHSPELGYNPHTPDKFYLPEHEQQKEVTVPYPVAPTMSTIIQGAMPTGLPVSGILPPAFEQQTPPPPGGGESEAVPSGQSYSQSSGSGDFVPSGKPYGS